MEWKKDHEYAIRAASGRLHMVLEREDENEFGLWVAIAESPPPPPSGPQWALAETFTSQAEGKRAAEDLAKMFNSWRN